MDNNPITFPEIQTLTDGITIGGRKIGDVEQVIGIKKAWQLLLSDVVDNTFFVSKSYFHRINSISRTMKQYTLVNSGTARLALRAQKLTKIWRKSSLLNYQQLW